MYTEVCNVAFTKQVLELLAMRQLNNNGLSFAYILQCFLSRSKPLSSWSGELKCIWRESDRATALSLRGRRVSGLAHGDSMPSDVPFVQGLPHCMQGLSPFGMRDLSRTWCNVALAEIWWT